MTNETEVRRPDQIALDQMRERKLTGTWYAYENHDLGHPQVGHLKFLCCGAGQTLSVPPERMPDMSGDINWGYVLIGYVDLETGEIREGR